MCNLVTEEKAVFLHHIKSVRLALLLLLVSSLIYGFSPAASHAQNRLALVIGNDDYENVAKLRKAVNDARGIGNTLSELGFDVTRATNVSRRQMNKALQDFNNKIVAGDTVLFFFAGHGVEIEGENYLLPVDVPDANRDQSEFIKAETVRLNRVLADLRAKKARMNIVILDACRDNPFSKNASRSLGGARGLAHISAPQGTFVMYSADAGEAALDRLHDNDDNPNSIFTRTLIPLMKTPGMDLVKTARTARRKVRKLALSVSHDQTPAYYDAVLGDFYFTAPNDKLDDQSLSNIKPDFKIRPEVKNNEKPITELALRTNPKERDQSITLPESILPPLPTLIVTAGEKDKIKVWNADDNSLLAELPGQKRDITSVKLINKGRNLLVAGYDHRVTSYDLPSFRKSTAFQAGFEISVMAQTKDGTIMVGGKNGVLAAFNGKTYREIWRRQAHDDIISPILVLKDQVVTASADGAIVVTETLSGKETLRLHTFKNGRITDIAFVNHNTLVAVHEKGSIAYISIPQKRVLKTFRTNQGWISSVDVTPDGSTLVTAGVNGNLTYWPIGGNKPARTIAAHTDVATGAKFLSTKQGNTMISVGFDGKLLIWKNNGQRMISKLNHGPAIVYLDYLSGQ